MSKVWFITGASRGLGRVWTEAALARGDRVVATARNPDVFAELADRFGSAILPLALDVTNRDQAYAAVAEAHEHFSRLDVVVNNAGYGIVGAVEEVDETEVRNIFETNYFGAMHILKAVLPLLRAQGGGHILGISSTVGVYAGPIIGYYCASKWAFEAMHEAMAKEVSRLGIKVTLIEPNGYATSFHDASSLRILPGLDAYSEVRMEAFEEHWNSRVGDPMATPEAIMRIVDAENPPLRFWLGSEGLPMARAEFAQRLAIWEEWAAVSNAAQGVSQTYQKRME